MTFMQTTTQLQIAAQIHTQVHTHTPPEAQLNIITQLLCCWDFMVGGQMGYSLTNAEPFPHFYFIQISAR